MQIISFIHLTNIYENFSYTVLKSKDTNKQMGQLPNLYGVYLFEKKDRKNTQMCI